MEKLVSVLVPCYKHEKYIESCLKSIIGQTYQNIELIICDDCSPDSSFKVICSIKEQLEMRFSRVIIIQNKFNQGITKNLNKMIKLANGEFIKILASDDMLMSNCIKDLVNFLEKNSFDVVFSNGWEVNECAVYPVTSCDYKKKIYAEPPRNGVNLTGELCSFDFIAAPTAIYPKETFEKFGMFDESLLIEDYEFFLRVSVKGNIGYLSKETVCYRVSDNSLSHFDGSKESVERMRKINKCRETIFKMYENYCNDQQVERFYNDNVALVLSMHDSQSLRYFINTMKQNKIKLNNSNKMKVVLYKIGMYKIIKKIATNFKDIKRR